MCYSRPNVYSYTPHCNWMHSLCRLLVAKKPQFSENFDIWGLVYRPPFTDEGQIWCARADPWYMLTVFSGLQVAPEYKPHPLFLPKIWKKIIDKSHLSISRSLFCYFLARRYVLGCIHVMRRSAKERQDAIDVVQKTLNAGLIAWAKVWVMQ